MRDRALDNGLISLTAGFAPAEDSAWRALVEKTLNGASFDTRLVSKTYDGIDVQPLYTAANASPPLAENLRGRAAFDADRAWDIRAIVDHPDPENANALAIADLVGGATSLLVKIDPAGQHGVAITSEADLAKALDGVLFDLAPIALDAGYLGAEAARWLGTLAHSQTLRPHLHLHLDPIGAFARTGVSPGPIEAHLAEAAEVARDVPATTAFLASGQALHEAGGTDAQEIAAMAAAGLAYVKASVAAGDDLAAAITSVALGVAADANYFAGVAKFRAARAVWARVVGAMSRDANPARIEARSSRRMLSTLDPWVNMLRLTSAAVGASIGGADAIVLDPFTQPLGRPTTFARRQARNLQLVLMEEAHLGRVADPAGGAWYLETLTDQLARAAWALFQAIERQGGIIQALTSGFITDAVAQTNAARTADVAKRRAGLVGVSEFPNLMEGAVEVDPVDYARFAKPSPLMAKPGPDSACPPLAPHRSSEGFEHLRAKSKAMRPLPSAFLATLGAPRDYTGRAGFIRNMLAAGGIDCVLGEAVAYSAAQTPLVVICGSDAGYEGDGEAVARNLKAQGAKRVYLAGRPGDLEAGLKAAGVDGFIFAGMDIAAGLAVILQTFESGAAA